jgi:hypothetical protein
MSGKRFRDRQNLPTVPPPPNLGTKLPVELQDLSILDRKSKFSLVNLVPEAFAQFIEKIPTGLFALSEPEFVARHAPDEIATRLKLKFWDEWQTTLLSPGGTLRPQAVYYGVCTREYFYDEILKNPVRLAWVITPPTDYDIILRETLYQGMARLREIIRLPITSRVPIIVRGAPVLDPSTGKPLMRDVVDVRLVSEIRQVITMLADRVHGALVHRVELQSQSIALNVNTTTPTGATDPLPTIETDVLTQIDRQLDDIRVKLLPVDELTSACDRKTRRQLAELGINPQEVVCESAPSTVDV